MPPETPGPTGLDAPRPPDDGWPGDEPPDEPDPDWPGDWPDDDQASAPWMTPAAAGSSGARPGPRPLVLVIVAVAALAAGAGAALAVARAQAPAPVAASSGPPAAAPGDNGNGGGVLPGAGSGGHAATQIFVGGRVLAVSGSSITIGGPGRSVTAAVTSSTRVTGRVSSIRGVEVGDLVTAQMTQSGGRTTVAAIQDPGSLPAGGSLP